MDRRKALGLTFLGGGAAWGMSDGRVLNRDEYPYSRPIRIEIKFGDGADPRIWVRGQEVTARCFSVDFIPGGVVRVGLFRVEPEKIGPVKYESGIHFDWNANDLARTWIEGRYTIKS